MTTAPDPTDDTAYLVERYVKRGHVAELVEAVTRLAAACADSTDGAQAVRYIHSTFVPAEDTCFCLLQAPSVSAVRAVNSTAGFPIDRISVAQIIRPPASCDRR